MRYFRPASRNPPPRSPRPTIFTAPFNPHPPHFPCLRILLLRSPPPSRRIPLPPPTGKRLPRRKRRLRPPRACLSCPQIARTTSPISKTGIMRRFAVQLPVSDRRPCSVLHPPAAFLISCFRHAGRRRPSAFGQKMSGRRGFPFLLYLPHGLFLLAA